MKKMLFGAAIIALLGAGCAASQPPASDDSNAPGNGNSNSNTPSSATLQPLPEIQAPKTPVDDSAWSTAVTKSGIVIKYPTKGGFAPTWTYQSLPASDPHLQGDCYVTSDTVYEKSGFSNFSGACQTATAFNAGPSARTDYFAFKKGNLINLVTLTKNYPAGFDMNGYGATVDHLLNAIR